MHNYTKFLLLAEEGAKWKSEVVKGVCRYLQRLYSL